MNGLEWFDKQAMKYRKNYFISFWLGLGVFFYGLGDFIFDYQTPKIDTLIT